jgi:hypothetical protein
MEGTARVTVRDDAEKLIVVFAESLKTAPWWRYHTLIKGGDSLKTLKVDDPDNFVVYDFDSKKLLLMIGDGNWAHLFRIHNGNHVEISKRSVTEDGGVVIQAGVKMIERSTFLGGLHTCTGRASILKDCSKDRSLKFDTDGLKYVWWLPSNLKYENANDIKW